MACSKNNGSTTPNKDDWFCVLAPWKPLEKNDQTWTFEKISNLIITKGDTYIKKCTYQWLSKKIKNPTKWETLRIVSKFLTTDETIACPKSYPKAIFETENEAKDFIKKMLGDKGVRQRVPKNLNPTPGLRMIKTSTFSKIRSKSKTDEAKTQLKQNKKHTREVLEKQQKKMAAMFPIIDKSVEDNFEEYAMDGGDETILQRVPPPLSSLSGRNNVKKETSARRSRPRRPAWLEEVTDNGDKHSSIPITDDEPINIPQKDEKKKKNWVTEETSIIEPCESRSCTTKNITTIEHSNAEIEDIQTIDGTKPPTTQPTKPRIRYQQILTNNHIINRNWILPRQSSDEKNATFNIHQLKATNRLLSPAQTETPKLEKSDTEKKKIRTRTLSMEDLQEKVEADIDDGSCDFSDYVASNNEPAENPDIPMVLMSSSRENTADSGTVAFHSSSLPSINDNDEYCNNLDHEEEEECTTKNSIHEVGTEQLKTKKKRKANDEEMNEIIAAVRNSERRVNRKLDRLLHSMESVIPMTHGTDASNKVLPEADDDDMVTLSNGEKMTEDQMRAIVNDNHIRSRIKKIMSVMWSDSYMAKFILQSRGNQTADTNTEILPDADLKRLYSMNICFQAIAPIKDGRNEKQIRSSLSEKLRSCRYSANNAIKRREQLQKNSRNFYIKHGTDAEDIEGYERDIVSDNDQMHKLLKKTMKLMTGTVIKYGDPNGVRPPPVSIKTLASMLSVTEDAISGIMDCCLKTADSENQSAYRLVDFHDEFTILTSMLDILEGKSLISDAGNQSFKGRKIVKALINEKKHDRELITHTLNKYMDLSPEGYCSPKKFMFAKTCAYIILMQLQTIAEKNKTPAWIKLTKVVKMTLKINLCDDVSTESWETFISDYSEIQRKDSMVFVKLAKKKRFEYDSEVLFETNVQDLLKSQRKTTTQQ